ncbi:hypothetical protein [Flavihumibacter petaseus]|nr:hypothetical protein [Flavihumibacter petaseus]
MTKSAWVLLGTVTAVFFLEASKKRAVCTIQGEIHPVKALRKVWLIQNGDTVPANNLGSRFKIAVKPGEYSVWIDAIAPYQDHLVEGIRLLDEQTDDLGGIELIQN